MKIKLFTHNDLDGIACAILAKQAFKDVDITYCNYDNINKLIKELIDKKEYNNYKHIYITDISVNEEIAELINNTKPDNFAEGFMLSEKFQLFDHHKTAEWLNKYFWARVIIEMNGEKISASKIFYSYLMQDGYLHDSPSWMFDNCKNLSKFINLVNRYDTWLWKEKYNDDEPKKWNDLFYIMGYKDFINNVTKQITSEPELKLNETHLLLLKYKQKEIDMYINSKNDQIIIKDILNYKVGIVFADKHQSELGNELSKLNPDLDFIAIINYPNSISYRTNKDYVDLSKVAKVYGGGGHAKAAGSSIDIDKIKEIVNLIFC